MNTPIISVVMPIYNSSEFLHSSINSILNQTFGDFELIMIDDFSTDSSKEIMNSYKDKRIIKLQNHKNLGNYAARNKGLVVAKGKYLCVMDSDDISTIDRFRKQFDFMEDNPEIGLAGSGITYLNLDNQIFRETNNEINKIKLLRNNYICHPSVIIRNNLLKKYNLIYDESFWYAGDYDLMVRASQQFKVTNMPDVLLKYRWSSTHLSASMNNYAHEIDRVRIFQIKNFKICPTPQEISIHLQLIKGQGVQIKGDEAYKWTKKLLLANKKNKYYNQDFFEDFITVLLKQQPLQ